MIAKRMIVTLVAAWICVGSIRAQEPETIPAPAAPLAPVAPVAVNDGPFPAALFNSGSAAAAADRPIWISGDVMGAYVRGTTLPTLVTTSPGGTPRTAAGIPGLPTTTALFGGEQDGGIRPGLRINAGYWFDDKQTFGVEGGFMWIASRTANFSDNSTDGTILARPYVDAATGTGQAVLVAYPGSSNGSVNVQAQSSAFYEFHFDLTEKAIDIGWFRMTSLIGYRYFGYNENLSVRQTITPVPGNPVAIVPGTQIATNDNFSTTNQFNGLDMGFRSQFFLNDAWSIEVLTKAAVGRLYRSASVEGNQTISVPGTLPLVQQGGVYALQSNSGKVSYSDWRVLPEAGFTLNWQVRSNLELHIGYTFLYLNAMARAGDQIDTNINPNLFPGSAVTGGPARPALNLMRSDMWIQTINLGLEWTY